MKRTLELFSLISIISLVIVTIVAFDTKKVVDGGLIKKERIGSNVMQYPSNSEVLLKKKIIQQ